MKYINCPTCGGQAKFISGNFERAGILVSAENEQFRKEFEQCSEQLEVACRMVKKKIEDMDSEELFFLYRAKLQQEILNKEIERELQMIDIDRMSKEFTHGLKRMFGELEV